MGDLVPAMCKLVTAEGGGLRTLRLGGNGAWDDGVSDVVVEALSSGSCVMEELDVGGCSPADVPSILTATEANDRLRALSLSGTALIRAGNTALLESLLASRFWGSLQTLRLGDVCLCGLRGGAGTRDDKGLQLLCAALQRPNALKELTLHHNSLRDEDALQLASVASGMQLDLRFNHIFNPYHKAFPSSWELSPPDLAGATIPVDASLASRAQSNIPSDPSRDTHNLITISEGMLALSVKFGDGGDSDQYLGVLEEEALKNSRATFSKLRERGGWCVKDSSSPYQNGEQLTSINAWPKLRGNTVNMLLDVPSRTVSFWMGEHTVTLRDLPEGKPLTAAVGLYGNTATVTGLCHILPRTESRTE